MTTEIYLLTIKLLKAWYLFQKVNFDKEFHAIHL